ncbi:helix-turn-helix domain-containing protein [Pseudofrankia inefficax]|uniref:Helix-turn-helix domain protein n=1 Tax=Pseudofrankia inefficax (strain DSM 45817 / CECT 9037 / DDB 130130 / EuI1c) TaxID=298654 RepID=E3J652_PSEI1|nr:helix-turn-helix transcriptional regulator [Pseudofrankia inefficax]ADP78343.1 helix-turn-helix domain protein [Pseudofrankia inefficax]
MTACRPVTPRARGRVGGTGAGEAGPDGMPHRGRTDVFEAAFLRDGFGAALRSARQRRGWSRRTLAGRSGVSWSAVRALETGVRRPRAVTVRYLAAALALADPAPLAAELLGLAGESLRPDTAGAVRQRRRASPRAVALRACGR